MQCYGKFFCSHGPGVGVVAVVAVVAVVVIVVVVHVKNNTVKKWKFSTIT